MTSPGREVVISGISCRLPMSDNMEELKENLLNGLDMINPGQQRINTEMFHLPHYGQIKDLSRFDASFFGISAAQANKMDPSLRILMEVTYEAIADAGIDPLALRKSDTGVYVGTGPSQFHFAMSDDIDKISGYEMTGSEQCMLANRLSNWFDFRGPSLVMNTACSSSLVALDAAVKDVRQGVCRSAIVAGVNVLCHPGISKQLHKLGMLSPNGRCASFDEEADGYCRSEGIVAIIIQRKEMARRIYCEIVHSKVNNNGSSSNGIILTSKEAQCKLLRELYEEANVNPADMDFIEAHATGTQAGDKVEAESIAEVFCTQKRSPLKIGSVKSNLGHTENASGLVSLAKVIIALETKIIPKTLHYSVQNSRISELCNGKLEVVQENQHFKGDYIGINNFGFGGTNAHVLLKTYCVATPCTLENSRAKLVLYSSREPSSVEEAIEKIAKYDQFFHVLLRNANLMAGMAKVKAYSTANETSWKTMDNSEKQVWYVFTGMGAQWHGMGKSMMEVSTFRKSIMKSNMVLQEFDIDLEAIIEKGTCTDGIVDIPVMITAIQIALYDILCDIGIKPDGIIGHSVGELACAYADGCLTREETLYIAYKRAYCIQNADLPHGAMAAIGLSLEQAESVMPKEVTVACHNAQDSVTISGRTCVIDQVIKDLNAKGVFSKHVNTNGIAFHSNDLHVVEEPFREAIKQVLKTPRIRSKKWISTVIPNCMTECEASRYLTADYLTKSLTSPVLFYEATRQIPNGAVVIEIAPHCLLQQLLRRSLPTDCYITGLLKRDHENMSYFMSSLGKLFERGICFDSSRIEDQISFPVPTGTPMISPVVKWDHTQTWDIPSSDVCIGIQSKRCFTYTIDISEGGEYSHLRDHKINGRVLFPASGYIYLTWKTFARLLGKSYESQAIKFMDVEFHQAVILREGDNDIRDTSLEIDILKSTGRFGVSEGGSLVASGYVSQPETRELSLFGSTKDLDSEKDCTNLELEKKDVYKELCVRGYEYGRSFQCIESSDLNGHNGTLRWSDRWEIFLDAMLQYPILSKLKRGLYLPWKLRECLILPNMTNVKANCTDIPVQFIPSTNTCECQCAVMRGLNYLSVTYQNEVLPPSYKFKKYTFNSYFNEEESIQGIQRKLFEPSMNRAVEIEGMEMRGGMTDMKEDDLKSCLEIVLENSPKALNILAIDNKDKMPSIDACLSRHQNYTVRYYNLKDNLLQKCKIVHDENNKYSLTFEDSFTYSEFFNELNNFFHFVLCQDTGYSEQTRTYIHKHLSEGGFLLFECVAPDVKEAVRKFEKVFQVDDSFMIIYDFKTASKITVLCRKKRAYDGSGYKIIQTTLCNFNWVNEVKKSIVSSKQNASDETLWLVSDEKNSGLVGFVKCLRSENYHHKIRCIINQSDSPLGNKLITEEILAADMVFNVINQGRNIGYYRHMPIKTQSKVQTTHAYVRIQQSGNLSSLQWTQSPEAAEGVEKHEMYTVCYSALNFRDVMLATGKLSPAANPGKNTNPEQMLGMEFSGLNTFGKRVMGLVSDLKGISTSVSTRNDCVWPVPDEWTLEQAASVPMAYLSAYLALVIKGNIAKRESILIHSGSGGLGQAAIAIALSYECTVFTTVSTEEKMEFLLARYPNLDKRNIFSSRDTAFEQKIMYKTGGAGVDIVLNSLAGDVLHASVRVLNSCGRFLEMGKSDLFHNSSLGMQMFLKNASFHGVHLDFLVSEDTTGHHMKRLSECFNKGISGGVVNPLNTTVFDRQDIEDAFRFMTKRKHIGKVLIKLMDEKDYSLTTLPMISAEPRVYFSSSKWYIITGGLGGIGLELAEWLSDRGAKSLVLTSRTGVKTAYQKRKLSFLRDKGIDVQVSTRNVSKMTEAESLLHEFRPLGGIFHLAMVLKDGVLENQDETTFKYVFESKAQAAINLDKLTRHPSEYSCDWFVCFSSIACGRGNAGQTNYGYANSVTESVCENRKRDGLHGLAIQFGPISQVGVFHETMRNTTSTLAGAVPQSITSCLATLEKLMNQSEPVVSCFLPEEDTKEKSEINSESRLVSSIFRIIGIDEQRPINVDSRLNELGLDSLNGIEVRQLLERHTRKSMSLQHVQNITIKELKQLANHSPFVTGE